jgi:NAD(P)-dependent dehydrogenase (short-subunit alcohol dehydrogenase family)
MRIEKGLVVFVTGGASGLGEATVRRMHAAGASVVIADMNTERMELISKELGERILIVKCDVTKEAEVEAAIKLTVDKFGAVHVALACAGVAWPSMMLTSKSALDTKNFEILFRINVFGSAYVAKHAAVAMSKNKAVNDHGEKGLILFVSSVAADEGQRGQVAYGGSKGAINGMVMPMARDLGKFGIRAVAIAPGIFETPMGHAMPKQVVERLQGDTPMARLGKPDEFAHFVGAIIENSYVNGVHLRVDGAIKMSNL